jgi:hypothetical protein
LGRINPEDMSDVATHLLGAGYDGPHLRALAGRHSLLREADAELVDAALEEIGAGPVDNVSAAWTVVRSIARSILRDEVAPHEGAQDIGSIARMSPELQSLNVFAGLASEWEDDLVHRSDYEEDIRDEAKDLVEPG